jgi:hypothetical protein
MSAILSGPMFEPSRHNGMKSVNGKQGGHYNVFYLDADEQGQSNPAVGMQSLRSLFPDGEANELNVCLFSTSGVHGSYTTIEDIETSLTKYGDEPEFGEGGEPDDYAGDTLTVLVLHPRTVCTRWGNVRVALSDIAWLKKLRASSHAAVSQMGLR